MRFRAKCTSLTAVAVRAALYLAGWAYGMENISVIAPEKRRVSQTHSHRKTLRDNMKG